MCDIFIFFSLMAFILIAARRSVATRASKISLTCDHLGKWWRVSLEIAANDSFTGH